MYRSIIVIVLCGGITAQYKNCGGEITQLGHRKEQCEMKKDRVWVDQFNAWGDVVLGSCVPIGSPIYLHGETP